MRGLRPGPARDALALARLTDDHARRTGCGLDEAAEHVAAGLTRRRLLQQAGIAAAAAAVPLGVAERAVAAPSARAVASPPKVVVIGAGMAGLGCALRLREKYGIHAEIYDSDDRPGGRIRTLRGHFAGGQLVEEHAEFINPEHTHTLALAKRFGLSLDNTDHYRNRNQDQETFRFHGKAFPQATLNRDWHRFGWKALHDAAAAAPFPTLYRSSTRAGRRFDHMSVPEWLDHHVPGGAAGDFGQVCISAVLDEYGGPPEEQSALNLVYLLGGDATTNSGNQPKSAPELGGGDEKWHITGGNDQLTRGVLHRLRGDAVRLSHELIAIRGRGHGRYTLTLRHGHSTRTIAADHVVLALPFTTLRDVELHHAGISRLHHRAIREEPLGSNAKMFLQMHERPWVAQNETANAYCRGIVQGAWDAAGYQKGKQGILSALPGGHSASSWGARYHLNGYRGTPPAAMVRDFLRAFEGMFPGVTDAYNGHAFFVWSDGDPHVRGAYSYLKVGQYTGFNGIQARREGNLHFAGEHTSVGYQGYIEGALRSGQRCADEVAGKA